ncbi:MAG TPA: hypothetical protein VLS93_01570 [Anaeromyxobacteraceae bacterium]|nr:hypothetical protein [Anaeromyxobacteraceae bacterium]
MRLAALLLLAPAVALAEPESAPASPPPAAEGLPRFGLMLDAGLPDGAVISAVFRPVESVRFTLGGAYNVAGYGVRGGIGWLPFRWAVSPSLNVEAGRYFDSDLTWIVDEANGVPAEVRPLLERVGYNYASAQIGLEIGSPRGISLSVRAGLSYLWTVIHGVAETIDAAGGSTAIVNVSDPRLRATLPSVKVGVLYYF